MVIFKFRDFSCRDPQEWIVGHPISRFLSHKNPKLLMGFLSKSYGSTMGMGGPWNVPLQISQFQVPVLCFRGLAARKSRLFKSKMVHEVPFPFKKLRHYLFCCYSNQTPLPVLGPFGWILSMQLPGDGRKICHLVLIIQQKNWTRPGDLSFLPSWQ